jgi:stearoyl-CoA desaturase (Delta-9 desaturase)
MHVWLALGLGVAICQVALLATTVYLHRSIAHRAVTLHPVVALPLRFVIWVTTGIRPREWAAVHRRHHAACDTPADPHSPAVLGFWRVQVLNALLYQRATREHEANRRYMLDLKPDRWDRWFFDHDVAGPLLGLGALCLVVGWSTALVAGAIHAVLYVQLNSAINAVGHTHGSRPHSNSGTNGIILALITAGEGLHNNHHDWPTCPNLSRRRIELDPGYWFIRMLSGLQLATIRVPVNSRRERDASW